jgi:hypothetical protein
MALIVSVSIPPGILVTYRQERARRFAALYADAPHGVDFLLEFSASQNKNVARVPFTGNFF